MTDATSQSGGGTGPGGLPFTINLQKVNKIVGYTAFGLPWVLLLVTALTGACFNASISHYYYTRIGGDFFVGALTFIGMLLLFFYVIPDDANPDQLEGYRHHNKLDMILLKIAGAAAFGIAFVPANGTGCDLSGEVVRAFLTDTKGSVAFPFGESPVTGTIGFDFWATWGVTEGVLRFTHFGSALVMFSVLAYFSAVVFARDNSSASKKSDGTPHTTKLRRNSWYRVLGIIIAACIVAIGLGAYLSGQSESFVAFWDHYRLTFVFEAIALMSFGLSWLIKGRFIKYFEDPNGHHTRKLAA